MRCSYLCLLLIVAASGLFAAEKGDRDKAMALLTGADSLITANEHQKAADMCKRALSEDASCPAAYFKLAQCNEQLRQNKEAFKNYQTAADLAKKENDLVLSRKATSAAEKIGGGAIQITAADSKLVDKLLPLADEAFNDDQLETARSAYASILALKPQHEKAKEGLAKTEKAIEARGDPIKARIAAAMLAEVFYNMGIGEKDKATKMAQEIASKHGSTEAGREAEQLLANNFEPPSNIDAQLAEAKKQMKERAEKARRVAAVKPVTTTTTSSVAKSAPATGLDVEAIEKVAIDDAKKTAKDKLVPSYKDCYAKGKDFYSK
ncbi:MAG TPA: hypothetical protein VEK08_13335, partial [Planctomycetota bacterium]|nr:hypothetical protein [Planctomycetota bacterium]